MDIADLYDYEIAKVGQVWQRLMGEFSHRPSSRRNLDELAKRAAEEFTKIGFVVEVDTSACLLYNAATGGTGSPEIVVIGRVPGTVYTEQGHALMDHELKRAEVLTARERGEKFAGQRERPLKE